MKTALVSSSYVEYTDGNDQWKCISFSGRQLANYKSALGIPQNKFDFIWLKECIISFLIPLDPYGLKYEELHKDACKEL